MRAAWLVALLVIGLAASAFAADSAEKRRADKLWCADKFGRPLDSAPDGRRFALSMSGGGFRAMLYHIGALRRLNDAGLLAEIEVVSSVSGGSITAGMLAKAWPDLEFEQRDGERGAPIRVAANLDELVEAPLAALAATTVDITSVLAGFFPGGSAADRVATFYDTELYRGVELPDLERQVSKSARGPALRIPQFIFNATNLQTGELWQFRPRAMGGPVVGWTDPARVRLAHAVAASSAFPPFLSPLYLRPENLEPQSWHNCRLETHVHATDPDLHTGRSLEPGEEAEFRHEVLLTDGGVRDNLGLVAVLQINRRRNEQGHRELDILASDAGRSFGPERDPSTNWLAQGYRILGIATNEPDLLRIESLVLRAVTRGDEESRASVCREGTPAQWPRWRKELCLKGDAAYWSSERIPPEHEGYSTQPAELIEREHIRALGRLPTRLAEMAQERQRRLINWGYLSAHYGLPFINRLWREELWRLNACRMPHPDAGFTGVRAIDDRLCVSITDPKANHPRASAD